MNTGSVDEELLLRNEYLVTENRILRAQIEGRLKLTDGERKTLAKLGKMLGKTVFEEVANIVKTDSLPRTARRAPEVLPPRSRMSFLTVRRP